MATRRTTTPPPSPWAARFSREATAPVDEIPTTPPAPAQTPTPPAAAEAKTPRKRTPKTTTPATAPAPAPAPAVAYDPPQPVTPQIAAQPVPQPLTAYPTNRRGPAKRAVTYRLTDDTLDLIDLAVATAANQGRRLTREDAVANALHHTYNRLRKA